MAATEGDGGSNRTKAHSRAPRTHPGRPPADRVLVIRLGAMGDVVRTLPSVSALRSLYPGAHLAWLVEPAAEGVVDASGLVDETLVFPRPRLIEALRDGDALLFGRTLFGFLRTLRERRFEIVLDFHGLLKSGLLARLSGAPIRYGFAPPLGRELSWLFANRLVGDVDPKANRFVRNASMIGALAPEIRIPDEHLLSASTLAKARLTARLRTVGRERSRGFALVHPGSSAGAGHKRYPAEGWEKVIRGLADSGLEVWVAAGPNRFERGLAESLVRGSQKAAVLAPETRSFDDLLALLDRAAVLVAADSGPLHAASLAGVPVVQLMGPTHPEQNAPWPKTPARRLRVPLPCSPCRRGCADPACMRAIAPESVVRAASQLVSLHSKGVADSKSVPDGVSASEPGG